MTLDDFLALSEEEKLRVDFSAENAPDAYGKASPCEKYILYKAYTERSDRSAVFEDGRNFSEEIKKEYTVIKDGRTVKKIIDPDTDSKLLQAIYRKIWPELFGAAAKITSDTMTSVQVTMSGFFEERVETPEEKRRRLQISQYQKCSLRYMLDCWAKEPGADIRERVQNAAARLKKDDRLEAFLSAWHTLGNYCPVPRFFNRARSQYGKYDFWDLTLMMIRKWYLTGDTDEKERILKRDLFHNQYPESVPFCTKWLRQFGDGEKGWETYVDAFCFQDWVSREKTDSYYKVIPLWDRHDWEHLSLPSRDWGAFFTEFESRIAKRARRLIQKLEK